MAVEATNYAGDANYTLAELKELYHPNLLINGDFQINQRGETSYTGDKYSLDMWYIQGATLTINDDGSITLSGGTNKELWQFIQNVTSDTITFSLKVNGSIYTGTATNVLDGSNHDFAFDNDNFYVRLHNNPSRGLELTVAGRRLDGSSGDTNLNIKYIDLFEGSIAYPHVKEDKAIALTRCRERIVAGNIPCVCYSDTVSLYLLFPNIQMPSKPTISYKQITITANGNKFSSPSATADDVYTNSGAGISVAVNLSKISQTVPVLTVLIAEVEAIVISCEPQ